MGWDTTGYRWETAGRKSGLYIVIVFLGFDLHLFFLLDDMTCYDCYDI